MKNFLKFAGFIAAVLGIVGFILMLATKAIIKDYGGIQTYAEGTTVIFGSTEKVLGFTTETKPSATALIAWILALVSILLECTAVVLPLLKVKANPKFLGLFNLIAVVGFVLAGIFTFTVIPTFYSANGLNVPDGVAIGAGWVIGAILFIAAGALAILPAALNFFGKSGKKGKRK